ncbi:MAG: hypothetical protein K2Q21_12305 [Chitinophagaceae bacterium]|nr:hypothetical protein [Chitinophagaceae bacterium]
MNSITEKIQEIVKAEEQKCSKDTNFKELQQIIDAMKNVGLDKRPDYTLPLADTIGKGYYTSLNRHQVGK